MARRVRLTKTQQSSIEGTELLQLLQSVTADGTLSAQEVVDLRHWLTQNKGSDVPAIRFLREVVERVVADGRVTRSEQEELYAAIERVMPSDLSGIAKQARLPVRDREKQRQLEQREHNRKREYLNFLVAGVNYEGRAERVRQFVRPEMPVKIVREPDHPYGATACRLFLAETDVELGYVPAELTRPDQEGPGLAALLDEGCRYEARVLKLWQGRHHLIPVVVVSVYGPKATRPGVRSPSTFLGGYSVAPMSAPKDSQRAGCGTACIAALVGTPAVLAVLVRWLA